MQGQFKRKFGERWYFIKSLSLTFFSEYDQRGFCNSRILETVYTKLNRHYIFLQDMT